MRVALIKCPRHPGGRVRDAGESLALGYLAAVLRAAGHDATIFNAPLSGRALPALVADVAAGAYDLVGLSISEPSLVRPSIECAARLRREGFRGHICAGGPTATFEPEALLMAGGDVDSMVLHEGEDTICELTDALEHRRDWRAVPGLAFLGRRGVERSSRRSPRQNLDDLPFPARDGLRWLCGTRSPVTRVPLLTSRGCYYDCSFCSVRAFFAADPREKWRRRSVANVLAEMDELQSRYGTGDVHIVDDLFVSRARDSRDYVNGFARALADHRRRFTFTLSASADSLDVDLLARLKQAGLRHVFVGAEAASPDLLRFLHRWFTPAQIAAGARALEDAGLEASISFINFTPMTRIDDLRTNLSFFTSLGANLLEGLVNRYQVYRGSPLFETLKRDGRLRGSFPFYDYAGIDARVELAYLAARDALSPLADLRVALGRWQDIVSFRVSSGDRHAHGIQSRLRSVRRRINGDVAALFETILEFAESCGGTATAAALASFVEETRTATRSVAGRWLATIEQSSDGQGTPAASMENAQATTAG